MQDRGVGLTHRRNVASAYDDTHETSTKARMGQVFRSFDANPKLKEDYASESTSGVITTLVCGVLCLVLFIGEFYSYRTSSVVSQLRVNPLGVDKIIPNAERLKIDIDITFHSLPCNLIALDTADKAGEQHFDVHDGHIKKRRLDRDGNILSAEFLSEKPNQQNKLEAAIKKLNETSESGELAATSQEGDLVFGVNYGMDEALSDLFPEGIDKAFENADQEGCEVQGYLEVNRVPGTFSIAPGRSLTLGAQLFKLNIQTDLDLSHTIHRLSFGESYPGAVSPLDGTHRELPPNAVHQYFLNVVSTTFEPLNSADPISTHQYSVTESFSQARASLIGAPVEPGVIFQYEISPIRVDFKETRSSFGSFMIGICSIIGGVVTMAGIVQRIVEYAIANRKILLVFQK